MNISAIRREYIREVLDEKQVNADPLQQFGLWLDEAITAKANDPTAMVLSTATNHGIPSSRIVLLKIFSESGFGFFTNYQSRKGSEIESNNSVALLFHWPELERQVRIEGKAVKTSALISDEYFSSRPFESQLSAAISNQSQVVPDREYLEKLRDTKQEQTMNNRVARPSFWGGYIVEPHRIEFWQGRSNRLHDRILFTKESDDWTISRLAP